MPFLKCSIIHLVSEFNPEAVPQLHLHLGEGVPVVELAAGVHVDVAGHLQVELDVPQRLAKLVQVDLEAFPRVQIPDLF